jgi:hypothetical protein
MPNVPFPLTAESLEELRTQVFDMIRQVYEDRIGGLELGDVFEDAGEILSLDVAASGGLEKSGGELQIKVKSDGGLNTASTGALVKIKPFGGLDTDSSGIFIKAAVSKGYREGLLVTATAPDELSVSSGSVEICGAVYAVNSAITITLTGIVTNTVYYIYVNAPATDIALATAQFSYSTTAPIWNDSYGALYKTGDNTKRYIARYYETA